MALGLPQKQQAHSVWRPPSRTFQGLRHLESACYFLKQVPSGWRLPLTKTASFAIQQLRPQSPTGNFLSTSTQRCRAR